MKRKQTEAIEFPANPFVALADVMMVLLLILILALLHQSLSSSRMIERMAVADLQNHIFATQQRGESTNLSDAALAAAFHNGDCKQAWVDGDLQRFRIAGELLFAPNSSRLRSRASGSNARDILEAFGRVLAKQQGNLTDPGSGTFKRIIIQGNTDASEGTDAQQWALSLDRAQAAVSVLQNESHLSPLLIEASGRGHWDPAELAVAGMSATQRGRVAASNRRLDIVIVYSGRRALQYLSEANNAANGSSEH